MAKARQYHTLLIKEGGRWCITFGDYDLQEVRYEFHDRRDHGVKATDLHIIHTSDQQPSIDAAVSALNA